MTLSSTVLDGPTVPPELRCVVEREAPLAVLRVSGVLDGRSANSLLKAVARPLPAHPSAIVVDVGGMLVGDRTALTVLATAARQAAQWPGVPLVLCSPNPEAEAALRDSANCRYLPVYPTLEAAMAGIEDDATVTKLTVRLQPAVGAARQARELVTEACGRWDVPDLVGPACTIVTELVNNVVVHAGTPMEVVVGLCDRYVNISVQDFSPRLPKQRGPATPTAPGGRGLMMVAAVAQQWGCTPVNNGKVVWAVLDLDELVAY